MLVAPVARPSAPNIGRMSSGCGVGIDAFASPICAQAMKPPLMHELGLDAEERRPPQHEIGQLADLDRADLVRHAVRDRRVDRVLRDVAADAEVVVVAALARRGGRAAPSSCAAVCQVRVITSPTRPIAWLSLEMMLIAPRSWRMSSAAIVSPRMRLSAKATSSGMLAVEVVADHEHVEVLVERVHRERARRVGRARETFGSPQTRMMSGACPPPAPSEW